MSGNAGWLSCQNENYSIVEKSPFVLVNMTVVGQCFLVFLFPLEVEVQDGR